MKSDRLIEEIRSKIDIIDLIAEHVDLKRAGQNYKGLCPFHSEKTPSFMVNPSKQIFHCFGCNKGGDIFAFIMDYENMTFQEALSYLSDKAGLKIEDYRKEPGANRGLKENLFAIYKEAADFYADNLKKSENAASYLNNRGVDSETIEKFSIGYSRPERDALFNLLKKKGFSSEHIKAAGLVYFGQSSSGGGKHDFFRDRLMFPIFDLQGRIIAFGGRTLSSSKDIPKYINSPDSIIFKKGETCYGLNTAKGSIPRKGYSIVVEGYLDTISCHRHGFSNAIAPLGTALTAGHLKKLHRLSGKVLLVFDGDPAGVSAAKRSIELIFSEGMTSKVLMLPQGEDPDTFLKKYGGEQFKKYMGKALSPVEFILKIYGKNKLDAVRYLLPIISACPDSLLRDEVIRELSDRSELNELTLREELKNTGRKTSKQAPTGMGLSQKGISGKMAIKNEEEILLNIALSMPEKARTILNGIDIKIIEDPLISGVFEKINSITAYDGPAELFIERLLGICDGEEKKIITRLSMAPNIDQEHVDGNIKDCFKKLVLRDIEKQIRAAEQAGDEKLLGLLTHSRKKFFESDIFRP